MKTIRILIPILLLTASARLQAQQNAKGYYKDIFIDGGMRVSSRADLPSARVLGMQTEVFLSAKKSKDYSAADTLLQEQCFGGSAIDENGVLLYPDGEPRFRMLYVHGGLAASHGKTLGERGRENVRQFVRNGGSYVGSCAGCFIASSGVKNDTIRLRDEYLGIWPGLCRGTSLSDTPTGISIDKKSPLLKYADFGGDRFVDSVYHNNGAYAYTKEMWPQGTEILARYDTKGLTVKRNIQGEPAIWAYKADSQSGRVIPCGSHPENVKTGERLDLMCAMVKYALAGNGSPTLKGELKNGEERVMDRHTHDNNPAYTNEDLLAMYMITGGVAKYVELLVTRGALTKDTIIHDVLSVGSYFLDEGQEMLRDEFGKDYGNYFSILSALATGETSRGQIKSYTGMEAGGYLDKLENDYGIISRKRPYLAGENAKNVEYSISDNFLNFWFRFIYRYRSAVEVGNLEWIVEKVVADYETFSGLALERYFRQVYAESGRYNLVTNYWKKKDGKDEIDLIAINEADKELVLGEIKRNPDKIKISEVQEKSKGIILHHKKWDIRYIGLSLKDM